ncbi:hypothetical protein JW698_00230 [Candidatus Wolfebacteria bacterium]|nr:hypothetical protein [Candidatus Wolfebacteria bacterium]
MYIGFTGINGLGKSTHAFLLHKWLTWQGKISTLKEEKWEFVINISALIAKNQKWVREVLADHFFRG